MDKEADKAIRDNYNKTALDYAILQENQVTVQLLMQQHQRQEKENYRRIVCVLNSLFRGC